MEKNIILKGVRTNNLRDLDVSIPLGKITAVVGVSGSGKSSLAFHTLYAEGYLRYIESISPYVRQFLDQVEKPDADRIDNLPPAVAFRQKKPRKNPRSIVATASDIFDYLRILYAKTGDFHCPGCGKRVRKFSIDEIIGELLARPPGRLRVCFAYQGDVSFLVNRGYRQHIRRKVTADIDGTCRNRPILVLVDELENLPQNRGRIFEAVDNAIALSRNILTVYHGSEPLHFPFGLFCPRCQREYEDPDENLFSFNSARGACPRCKGFGDVTAIDPERVFDPERSLAEGALLPLNTPANREFREVVLRNARRAGLDLRRPLREFSAADKRFLLEGEGRFPGLAGLFDYLRKKSYRVSARVFLSRFTAYLPCPACSGSRFNPLALAFRVQGRTIAEVLAMTCGEAREFIRSLSADRLRAKVSPEVLDEISSKLEFLVQSRLHYIQLNRPTHTLSRGEHQRINLAFIMGSTLSDSLLIIDRPSADLHPADHEKMNWFLQRLKKNGNTIVMIEHDPYLVGRSDHVLELGPGAGPQGGRIVFSGRSGTFFSAATTATQKSFGSRPRLVAPRRGPRPSFPVRNACAHNLKNLDLRIHLRALTVIAGVSGAGKSSLLYDELFLKSRPGAFIGEKVHIDPGITPLRAHSIVAGFFSALDPIREFFATLKPSRLLGYRPGHFSFDSSLGRCPECKGRGFRQIEMQFLPAVKSTCPLCRGSRFALDVLKVTHQGKSIADVLAMSVEDFCTALGPVIPQARAALQCLRENDMGYLQLGEKLGSLSMGEAQKLKLLKHLGRQRTDTLFLLDEPSSGLHPRDVDVVRQLLVRLLAQGHTVVAVEHNPVLIAAADFVIELGPEGGAGGGYLVFSGSPRQLLRRAGSPTGRHLKKFWQNA
ncbi:MAG: excinuclease ABC subunit UvrA [Candidatus Aminicenantes bacterium]|nr:excinuclease ABC subunit UvrA [Candidatus Aminicenantes bacterium]